jgi:Putative peptidoglycan binding domain
MMRKVLWMVEGDKDGLLDRASYVGAQAVCIRTTNPWLKRSVSEIKRQGFAVYAWRWPSIDPQSNSNHHYVDDEAAFVLGLIEEGADGYIVDSESDPQHSAADDWNDASCDAIADKFCRTIKVAGRQKNSRFLFGITSGCDYPKIKPAIPWSTFLSYSDAAFPQIYWAPNYITAKRTTPDAAWKIGMAAWRSILPGTVPAHPILGEIKTNTPEEIERFGQIMIEANSTSEVHFYAYDDDMRQPQWNETWEALRQMGATQRAAAERGRESGTRTGLEVNMPTGQGMLERARDHLGESYAHEPVPPKNDPNWTGPWDCSEFMSWLVYQEAKKLYGCLDDNMPPDSAKAFTGAWKDDAGRFGNLVSVDEAAGTIGGIVLRYPPVGGMGHIAICDGQGGTVEAKGVAYGVVKDTVQHRYWDTGVKIPGIGYDPPAPFRWIPPTQLYWIGGTNMDLNGVARIQQALAARGYDPGPIDGEFGPNTAAAVIAFQNMNGLVVDGQVGVQTARLLGVVLS